MFKWFIWKRPALSESNPILQLRWRRGTKARNAAAPSSAGKEEYMQETREHTYWDKESLKHSTPETWNKTMNTAEHVRKRSRKRARCAVSYYRRRVSLCPLCGWELQGRRARGRALLAGAHEFVSRVFREQGHLWSSSPVTVWTVIFHSSSMSND